MNMSLNDTKNYTEVSKEDFFEFINSRDCLRDNHAGGSLYRQRFNHFIIGEETGGKYYVHNKFIVKEN